MNEYDVNRKMASSCLPPAVVREAEREREREREGERAREMCGG